VRHVTGGAARATHAMTERPRTVTRDRLAGDVGVVDAATVRVADGWLRDVLALP